MVISETMAPRRHLGANHDGLSHVLRQQRLRQHLGGRLHRALLQDFGVRQPGIDHGGADSVLLFLQADGVREPDHAAFAGLVRGARNVRRVAGNRRDIDEVAEARLAHRREHRLGGVVRAVQVGGDELVPDGRPQARRLRSGVLVPVAYTRI